ncbi:hypothetical protein BDR06DRAFT_561466 [Suillus hirtellus]|nr:hypothetical protein BDR06DRAFT_561466 [Suillus hirtellus]
MWRCHRGNHLRPRTTSATSHYTRPGPPLYHILLLAPQIQSGPSCFRQPGTFATACYSLPILTLTSCTPMLRGQRRGPSLYPGTLTRSRGPMNLVLYTRPRLSHATWRCRLRYPWLASRFCVLHLFPSHNPYLCTFDLFYCISYG